jgi:hypothetical protein
MHIKNVDISKDSKEIQNKKCFTAQTVGRIEKLFSHKRTVAMRSSKQDPMLICSDDFFFGLKVTMTGYVSYHVYGT